MELNRGRSIDRRSEKYNNLSGHDVADRYWIVRKSKGFRTGVNCQNEFTYWMLSFCWSILRDVCTNLLALSSPARAIPISSFPLRDPFPRDGSSALRAISWFSPALRALEDSLNRHRKNTIWMLATHNSIQITKNRTKWSITKSVNVPSNYTQFEKVLVIESYVNVFTAGVLWAALVSFAVLINYMYKPNYDEVTHKQNGAKFIKWKPSICGKVKIVNEIKNSAI